MKSISVKKKSGPKEVCVASCLKVIGDKWTALILTELTSGQKRFTELERNLHRISPRTLSQRLDKLEELKIISKQCYAEVPPRIEYKMLPKGSDLLPVLQKMTEWGDKYPT